VQVADTILNIFFFLFSVLVQFIFNGTLADNVVFFHHAFDPHSPSSAALNSNDSDDGAVWGDSGGDREYSAALAASALESDLAALPGGDQTEVGSKGLNLSGGQVSPNLCHIYTLCGILLEQYD